MLRAGVFVFPLYKENLMSTQTATMATAITVNRADLIRGLDRIKQVVPARCVKPILTCVEIEAANGLLTLCATDIETSAVVQISTDGELPVCVVSCAGLIRRLKASKCHSCSLRVDDERLIVNGGRVEHALVTSDVGDFPVVPDMAVGDSIEVNAAEFCHAVKVTSVAVAREPSRYAINGILLESNNSGTRLVATDGRRLVMVELRDAGQLDDQLILPQRFCRLIEKFTGKDTDYLVLSTQRAHNDKGEPLPARLFVAGPDWLISAQELEAQFPFYRDVVPKTGSRFAVDGGVFRETLSEVALATSDDSRMVRLDLTADRVGLSAHASGIGASEATIPAKFRGGGDAEIHTAFNPAYVLDALKTLGNNELIIDVQQNGLGCDGTVFSKPALIYARHDPSVRWLLMPISAGLKPTRSNLGSNYRKPKESQS
jgi:DNA polymerase-3 subunit beta